MSSALVGKTVLVTGANRGLGSALVEEALKRGVKQVYAASRQPIVAQDARVTPLTLDVTDPVQIQKAAEQVESLDVLINNAGISVPDDLSDRSAFAEHLAVNLYGGLDVTLAFLPALTRSYGAVINVLSIGDTRRRAGASRLFGLQGGLAVGHPVAARTAGRPGRERLRRHARPDRHRHGAGSRHPENAG